MRVGFGYDIHRLEAGRPLILGGVRIDSPLGPRAHSDGDVVIHALIDALLGACGCGDIGRLFPPEDPRFVGISSLLLLRESLRVVREAGFRPVNVDCTVLLEAPRIAPYAAAMRQALAAELGVEPVAVSVKGKTREGCGETGRRQALEAYAAVLVEQR